ncbi:NUDIX hydrolase [Candidatus Roizmanbacteria bacterium]|nr:NUDIX hydrolase [Candidatus Roizmanbacteria bacterium]
MALVRKDNKYLLTCRQELEEHMKEFHGIWQIPGGGLEFGETPEQCAVRELKEEAGIDIELVKVIPHIRTAFRPHWQGVFITYLARQKDPSQPIVINEEACDFGWFTPESAKALIAFPETVDLMKIANTL